MFELRGAHQRKIATPTRHKLGTTIDDEADIDAGKYDNDETIPF